MFVKQVILVWKSGTNLKKVLLDFQKIRALFVKREYILFEYVRCHRAVLAL